jgi:Tfp pilus assembly protein PilP
MSQLSNPFLEVDLPDSEEIYEPTPFGISALTNVDHLMDDVFQDLEQLLVRGAVLPNDLHEEPAPEPVRSAFAAPLLMPSCLTPPPQSAAAAYLSAALANGQMPTHLPMGELPPDASVPNPSNAPNALPDRISPQMLNSHDLIEDPDLADLMNLEQITVPPRKSGNGGLVLSAILGTLLVTGGLYATLKYRLYQMIPGMRAGVTEASAPQSAESGKDQQFLDYVGRSLNRIDRTAARDTGTIATAPGTVPGTIPSTIPGTVPPPPDLLTVPSVVTVPPVVGTLPAAQPPVFGSFTNQPGVTPPRAVPGTVAAPVSPVKASPAARPAARSTTPTVTRPTAVSPAATQTAPSLPVVVSPSPVATALTPNFDASETHSLIGLLELGDRSAALMAVNGVPQRIQVGEKIGASGWQVMSITNQAAIIQRNNEVRSIYVGQQF